jgi:hypothetical protein
MYGPGAFGSAGSPHDSRRFASCIAGSAEPRDSSSRGAPLAVGDSAGDDGGCDGAAVRRDGRRDDEAFFLRANASLRDQFNSWIG